MGASAPEVSFYIQQQLSRSRLRPLQHHREKSVAPMHTGQHAQCAIPHRRSDRPSGHILLQHINRSQPRDQRPNRNPPQPSLGRCRLHHLLILLRLQRTGEYTSRPPAASRPSAPLRIARCRADCRVNSSRRRRCRISGLRASVPVPLHGTSQRIRSNFASRSSSGGAAAASITAQRTRSAYAYRRSRAAICANRFALHPSPKSPHPVHR